MLFEGSSSDDSNPSFAGLTKHVQVNHMISNSEESSSNAKGKKKTKRKNYTKKINSLLLNNEDGDEGSGGKTKGINKNCLSAKKSRERKKEYLEALESMAAKLKSEIMERKEKITGNRNGILAILKQSNPEVTEQELRNESKLLAKQLEKMKKNEAKAGKEGEEKEIEVGRNPMLKYMLDSFLYKFGFNGVLRKDVIEQLKMKWYEIAIDEKIIGNGYEEELRSILQRFKDCLDQLANKNNDMEFLLRNLQKKIDEKDMIPLMLRPQFLEEVGKERSSFSQEIKEEYIQQQSEEAL